MHNHTYAYENGCELIGIGTAVIMSPTSHLRVQSSRCSVWPLTTQALAPPLTGTWTYGLELPAIELCNNLFMTFTQPMMLRWRLSFNIMALIGIFGLISVIAGQPLVAMIDAYTIPDCNSMANCAFVISVRTDSWNGVTSATFWDFSGSSLTWHCSLCLTKSLSITSPGTIKFFVVTLYTDAQLS